MQFSLKLNYGADVAVLALLRCNHYAINYTVYLHSIANFIHPLCFSYDLVLSATLSFLAKICGSKISNYFVS
ncbi:hypothetical protein, partial [Oligella sp. HMSC09E12]|uniref:hypothetical protein n=1 Tax=Oligella sp. HMSC09E12 TaxID=1581147 RepID=UPI001AEF70E1